MFSFLNLKSLQIMEVLRLFLSRRMRSVLKQKSPLGLKLADLSNCCSLAEEGLGGLLGHLVFSQIPYSSCRWKLNTVLILLLVLGWIWFSRLLALLGIIKALVIVWWTLKSRDKLYSSSRILPQRSTSAKVENL